MTDREPRAPFSFAARADDERTAEAHRRLGRKLSLGGLILAVLVTTAPLVKLLKGTPLELAAPLTRAYKWRDAEGNWQIGERPPADGTPYETIEVSGDMNVLPLPPKLQAQ